MNQLLEEFALQPEEVESRGIRRFQRLDWNEKISDRTTEPRQLR